MVNQDTDIVALMDIATLVHDTEYKTKQSFGESDPQRLTLGGIEKVQISLHLLLKSVSLVFKEIKNPGSFSIFVNGWDV
jgi:hypothetical protein